MVHSLYVVYFVLHKCCSCRDLIILLNSLICRLTFNVQMLAMQILKKA